MQAIKTFRRDKLRRLIEAGKVTLAGAYHFDDMHGESRTHKAMPVAMRPADYRERKQGICYIGDWELNSGSGRAWLNPNGTVTLYVHSNSNYDFTISDNNAACKDSSLLAFGAAILSQAKA